MCPENQSSNGGAPSLTSPQETQRISAGDQLAESPHFQSILFQESSAPPNTEAPDFFHDVNLDQIVAAVVADWPNCDLEPLFHTPLSQASEITYRQDVMCDLDNQPALEVVNAFLKGMRTAREHWARADGHCYKHERERWILDACYEYCKCVERFCQDLHGVNLASAGMTAFCDYLGGNVRSPSFGTLIAEAKTTEIRPWRYPLRTAAGRRQYHRLPAPRVR